MKQLTRNEAIKLLRERDLSRLEAMSKAELVAALLDQTDDYLNELDDAQLALKISLELKLKVKIVDLSKNETGH